MRQNSTLVTGEYQYRTPRCLRVLIVEDSEDDAMLAVRQLSRGGYHPQFLRVDSPGSMEAALRQSWDVVISDHSMPGFNAPDALAILNEKKPEIPFIVLSGYLDKATAATALQAGACYCLKKEDMELLLPVVIKEIGDEGRQKSVDAGLQRQGQKTWQSMPSLIEEHLPAVIWMSDLRLNLQYIGGGVRELTGYTAEEAMELGFRGLFDQAFVGKLNKLIRKDIQKPFNLGRPVGAIRAELPFSRKNGTLATVEILLKLAGGAAECPTGLIGLMQDISDRKNAELCQHNMEVRKMTRHLLDSLSQMAGAIAHEINNPLSVVCGYAQQLLQHEFPEETREDIKEICEGARRMEMLIKKMLQYAFIDCTEYAPVNINEILEVSLELCLCDLKAGGIATAVQLGDNLPELNGNAAQLQQVFVQLITNARIEMMRAHGKGKLFILTRKMGDTVSVSIRDNGPGIDKRNLKRIFEPFFTTRGVGEGQGLGLSICHAIITAHGGNIYAMGHPGSGCTFVVDLPACDSSKKSRAQ